LTAAQQQATRNWWDDHRTHYQLFISGLVLAESRRRDTVAAKAREKVLVNCKVLEYSEAAQNLTRERNLPRK
jgi:hypothetical protein